MIEGAHSESGEGGDDHSGHDHLRFLQEDDHSGHDDHSDEGVNAAKFGCAVLGGFLLPFVLNILFHRDVQESWADASGPIDKTTDVETSVPVSGTEVTRKDSKSDVGQVEDDVEQPVEKEVVVRSSRRSNLVTQMTSRTLARVNRQLAASILLGDGFHNFADGLFVAAAFKSCNSSVAIGIALGERNYHLFYQTTFFAISTTPLLVTLCHEIAQELADFFVLTNYCNMSTPKALLLNFVSGLSVLLVGAGCHPICRS